MISVVSAARALGRLREITSLLVRHGFGEWWRAPASVARHAKAPRDPRPSKGPADDTPEISTDDLAKGEGEKTRTTTAVRVRLVRQDLGPSFIKLGQIASTPPDDPCTCPGIGGRCPAASRSRHMATVDVSLRAWNPLRQ